MWHTGRVSETHPEDCRFELRHDLFKNSIFVSCGIRLTTQIVCLFISLTVTVKHVVGGRNKQVLPQWICLWCNIQFDNMGSVIFFECVTYRCSQSVRRLCLTTLCQDGEHIFGLFIYIAKILFTVPGKPSLKLNPVHVWLVSQYNHKDVYPLLSTTILPICTPLPPIPVIKNNNVCIIELLPCCK